MLAAGKVRASQPRGLRGGRGWGLGFRGLGSKVLS